ncbi:hypothetical protein [Collimonas sp. OK412]|jgi:hypothetical protein|uniref:hypothetical protein n=1 Tax=Collimonas sp. (strain OK412) TaxID=1801619 RepID=UPI0008DF3EFD|nr:hypothetical protein [Collimonas sp. OK412]SFC77564.1 hypothetical protein SAMN04515619_11352 [Collimonas sp. OK412]
MNDFEKKNRDRLTQLLARVPHKNCPEGWRKSGTFAVGGLTGIGFSKQSEMLLVISSAGRGIIDCTLGEKVARDYESGGVWYSPLELLCDGIGPIVGEKIQIAGLYGGGLPIMNGDGESLEIAAPEWPKSDLIFCAPHTSSIIDGHQTGCVLIASDYFQVFGFSWSGNSFAFATSSDVTVFTKISGQN